MGGRGGGDTLSAGGAEMIKAEKMRRPRLSSGDVPSARRSQELIECRLCLLVTVTITSAQKTWQHTRTTDTMQLREV